MTGVDPELDRIARSAIKAGRDAYLSFVSTYGDVMPAGSVSARLDRNMGVGDLIAVFARLDVGHADDLDDWVVDCADMVEGDVCRSFDAQGFGCRAFAERLARHGFSTAVDSEVVR